MKRLALVMGRQGSGKTTRVCAELKHRFRHRFGWQAILPHYCSISIRDNHYNHIALDQTGSPVFVTGISHGRAQHSIHDALIARLNVLEIPHSGYAPPGINDHFNNRQLCTRAFVIMLPEEIWRSYDQEVGQITLPEYFMQHGPQQSRRVDVDYGRDCERIREDIRNSGIPAEYYASTDEMLKPIVRFLKA